MNPTYGYPALGCGEIVEGRRLPHGGEQLRFDASGGEAQH